MVFSLTIFFSLLTGDQNGTVLIYDMFYSNGNKVLSYPVTHCGSITGELPPNCPVTSIESIQWYPFDSGKLQTMVPYLSCSQ